MLRKSDFSLGWEIAYYLLECVTGASLGLLASEHSCAANTETWVYVRANKLPVIQHLLVLILVWIAVEKSIKCKIQKMRRLLLQGAGKRDIFLYWESQLENTRCGSVKKKKTLIKVSLAQRLKSGIAEKQGEGFKEMLNFYLCTFPSEMRFILCRCCKLCVM